MADEQISFTVSDNGSVERITKLLDALGVSGDEAIKRLSGALPTYSNAARAAEDQQKLMNIAIAAGIRDMGALGAAARQLTEAELRLAAGSKDVAAALQRVGAEEQAAAAKARELTRELTEQSKAQATANAARASGSTIAGAYGSAIGAVSNAYGAAARAGGSMVASLTSINNSVMGVATSIGVYVSATKMLHNVDAYESIKMSLAAVKRQGEDTNATFMKLGNLAVQTQQPFEALAKSFAQVQAALLKTADGGRSAYPVMENLAKAFYVTQTPAAASARVLHDFAEAMSQGNLQGQQLNSALMQSPQVMALFSEALGKNVSTLTAHAQHTVHLREKLSDLQNHAKEHTQTVYSATAAYNNYSNQIRNTDQTIQQHQAKLDALREARGNNTTKIVAEENMLKSLAQTRAKEVQGLERSQQAINAARDAQDRATMAKEEHIKKTLKLMDTMSRENIIAVLTSDKFREAINRLAADANGTVRGAFEALNTRFIMWLHTTGSADATVKAFNVTLNAIGQNLNVIMPIVGAFILSWSIVKIAAVITALKELAVALGLVRVATLALTALSNPYIAIVVAIGVAVAAVITYFDKWGAVMNGLSVAWEAVKSVASATMGYLVQAWNWLVDAMRPVVEKFMPIWIEMIERAKKAWDELAAVFTRGLSDILNGLGLANGEVKSLGEVFKVAWTQAIEPTIKAIVQGFAILIVGAITAVVAAIEGIVGAIIKVISWIDKAIAGFTAMKNAAAGATAGGGGDFRPATGGGARNGASWTVPGASGVDSRLIAVSPGERVTVQTPAQYYGHSAQPTMPPVRAAFRDGGTYYVAQTAQEKTEDIVGIAVSNNLARKSHEAPITVIQQNNSTVREVTSSITSASNEVKSRSWEAVSDTSSGGYSSSSSDDNMGQKALRRQEELNAAIDAVNAARQVTAVAGVSKPTSLTGWSYEQTLTWVIVNGEIQPNPNYPATALTKGGDSYAATQRLQEIERRPLSSFRDGGSFIVPGASGVDSRMINIAASPGEEISVKTPAQRKAEQGGGNNSARPVNVTIVTNDANSFARSKSQVGSDMKRQLNKVR